MTRRSAILLGLLATGCAGHARVPAEYDFDVIHGLPASSTHLQATITIPQVSSPTWLRTQALIYQLDYATPPVLKAYALSKWVASPAELLTLRLRQAVAAANSGFTLGSEATGKGYRLDVSLEQFVQVFSSPSVSHCYVTLSATLTRGGQEIVAQHSFHGEQLAASNDAAGGAQGLVEASDACLERMLVWLRAALQGRANGAS